MGIACFGLFAAALAQASPQGSVPAPPTAKPKIAVVGIRAEGQQNIAATAVDVVVTEIAQTERFDVISKNEIDSMLGLQRLKDLAGCDDVSCMAEIGGALGVERLVSGSIAKLGEGFVVNLQLINVAYGNVENRVSMQWPGREQDLPEVLRAAALQLVLPLKDKKPGSLDVTQTPPGAQIFVDNKPAAAHVERLEIGPHVLKVAAEDYEERLEHFVVKSGQALTLDGSLKRREAPTIEIRPVGLAAEFEPRMLRDTGSAKPMTGASFEGSYRVARRWRVGLRVFVPLGKETWQTDSPWPSVMRVQGGFAPGLTVAVSPLYRENTYDVALEAGFDVHVPEVVILNPTLPRDYSVAKGTRYEPGPKVGGRAGLVAEYYLSTAFSLGLAARYYWAAGYVIEFNGQKITRSMSGLAVSPRMTVRF